MANSAPRHRNKTRIVQRESESESESDATTHLPQSLLCFAAFTHSLIHLFTHSLIHSFTHCSAAATETFRPLASPWACAWRGCKRCRAGGDRLRCHSFRGWRKGQSLRR